MELTHYLPRSADEYIACFRQLSALISAAMDQFESKEDWVSVEDKNHSLQRLAESVETISSLRGDTGTFFDARPEGLGEYQKVMYAIEDTLRARLIALGYRYPKQS